MQTNFITKTTVAMLLGVMLLVGTASPVAAQTTGTSVGQNASVQAQIQMLMQMVAQLQAMLVELQKSQTVSSGTIQGSAPEHTYNKINSVVNGPVGIDLSSPLRDFRYDKSNPALDVIEFRWKASNVPLDAKVEITWERIKTFDYSGPIGGGVWQGEIPRGASTGYLKYAIVGEGTADAGEYRARIAVLDKNNNRTATSKWVKFAIIDSKKEKSMKSCTIKTDKELYVVGEEIVVSWTSKGMVNPVLVFDPNVPGVMHEMYGVRSSGSRTFIAKHENGAKGYEIKIGDEGKICSVYVVVAGKIAQMENLSISSIALSQPKSIVHTSIPGFAVPDQKVKVVVKNNEFGRSDLKPRKFNYIATLYEFDANGKRNKTGSFASGEAMVPAGLYGSSEFEFYIEGGLPFDGENFEKKYQVQVEIDVNNVVKESNEKDNSGWSKRWITSYYKG